MIMRYLKLYSYFEIKLSPFESKKVLEEFNKNTHMTMTKLNVILGQNAENVIHETASKMLNNYETC